MLDEDVFVHGLMILEDAVGGQPVKFGLPVETLSRMIQ